MMNRRDFALRSAAPLLVVVTAGQARAAFALSEADAASGVRTALERGANAAVDLLSRPGGYLDNPKVKIPLPGYLNDAAKLLKGIGQGRRVDELVTAMNRAAEAAVPEAKALLVNAVKTISVEDALRIVRGGETSVTQFFSRRTRVPLTEKFLPIVTRATERVALAEKYNSIAEKASKAGLLKKQDANLQDYVTGKSLDGLYFMIGEEEKKIRRDPIGTGSEILRKVFGK
jgi:hypothetical protein